MKTHLKAMAGDALILALLSLASFALVAGSFWLTGIAPLPFERCWTVHLADGVEQSFGSREALQAYWAAHSAAPRSVEVEIGYRPAEGAGDTFLVSLILTFVGLGTLAAFRCPGGRRSWLRGGWGDVAWGGGAGAGLLALGFAYDELISWIGVPVIDVAATWTSLGSPTALAILACVAAPVAEEAYFRGRVHDLVATSWGGRAAIAVSAALFAAAHVFPHYLPITFLFGCVFGWLRVRRGNLIAPMVAHAVNNGVGLFLLG